jgi:23S rRNA G2069 N7-methylase RlmK/C1962 C5-methylase RlmI
MVYYYSVKIKTGLEEVHIGENAGPFVGLVLPGTGFWNDQREARRIAS